MPRKNQATLPSLRHPRKPRRQQYPLRPRPPHELPDQKPKKKKAKKKSGGRGNLLGNAFGKLAKNFVEELKDATGEISPKQLIESARDGIPNLRPGEKEGGIDEAPVPTAESPPKSPLLHATSASPPKAPLQIQQTVPPAGDETSGDWSPAKVQRAPKKRAKKEAAQEAPASEHTEDVESPVEGEVETVKAEAEAPAASDTPGEEATQEAAEPEAAVADGGPTLEDVDTPSYSPAKVQRANRRTPKKDKEEEPAPANEDEIEAVETEVEAVEAEAPAEEIAESEAEAPETI